MSRDGEPTRVIRVVLEDDVWTAIDEDSEVAAEGPTAVEAVEALQAAVVELDEMRGRHEGEAVERFRQHREEERERERRDERDSLAVEDEPPLEGQLVFKGPVDECELGPERRRD